jgi:putative transposase
MHPPRLKNFDYLGPHAYFLTICTADRHLAFESAAVVDRVRDQLLRTADAHGFEITAYCFMPDHLHLVLTGTRPDSDFRTFVAIFKQHTGYMHRRSTGLKLWQENYYEHVLRPDDSLPEVIAYVLGNPLRARLVEKLEDYPFLGSARYTLGMLGDFVQTRNLPWR